MAFFNFGGSYPEGFGLPGPFQGAGNSNVTFSDNFKCYSMIFFSSQKEEANHGGKIILPPSALERLARLNITYPMLFRVTNLQQNRHTHCGVLEFSAEEGRVFVPRWMLEHLYTSDGELLHIENVSLPLATFSKFQPQSVDFLDISNPKAVLELKLRLFACLTKGDMIQINYNHKIYELLVLDTHPQNAVSIIECDMKVDFAPPVGYRDPTRSIEPMETTDNTDQCVVDGDIDLPNKEFKVFSGQGQRLDGKAKKESTPTPVAQQPKRDRGIPNYKYIKGKITFAKAKVLRAAMEEPMEDNEEGFVPFTGYGQKLKTGKKRTHPH